MKTPTATALKYLKSQPVQIAIGAVIVLGFVYYLTRKAIGETVDAAGGLLSGNNAITKGTAFEGKGVLGTLGGAVDKVAGGAGTAIGTSAPLQNFVQKIFNDGYDGYLYSTKDHRYTQVIRRSDAKIFNVDATGKITGPAA